MGFHGTWAHLRCDAVRLQSQEEKDFLTEFPVERFFKEEIMSVFYGFPLKKWKFNVKYTSA